MKFCTNCGQHLEEGGRFCIGCGTPTGSPQQQLQPDHQQSQSSYQQPQTSYQQPQSGYQQPQTSYQPPQPGYQQPQQQKMPKRHYAPGSFIERLHNFGSSIPFLVGIILFSAGSLFSLLMTFTVWSVFSLMILALPITGFWLIFASSKTPRLPEKTLPALTLFKVTAIIDLVVMSLMALILLIVSIMLFVAANELRQWGGDGIFMGIGFFMLLIAGGVVVFAIIYFRALLGIIKGLRNGITYNIFQPLPSVKIFSILTYIGVGISVFGALITIAATNFIMQNVWNVLQMIPRELHSIITPLIDGLSNTAISTFFTLVTSGGIVVCLVVLNQFNNSLQASAEAQHDGVE